MDIKLIGQTNGLAYILMLLFLRTRHNVGPGLDGNITRRCILTSVIDMFIQL